LGSNVGLYFINSGHSPAAFNMAADEFLFKKESGLFLRVYGWRPPAVSLGYGQKAEKELDLPALKKAGIDVVRRPTGGRAILHDKEITYSVAGDIGGMFGPDLNSTYRRIAGALMSVLKRLGVECEMERAGARDVRNKSGASLPCFSSVSRYELKINGKKIIGSAQRRDRRRFLQHGSLMLEKGLDITDYLAVDAAKRRDFREGLKESSISLGEALGSVPAFETCAKAFEQGFAEAWETGVEPVPAEILVSR
jgi:lipoate-protein ligase A